MKPRRLSKYEIPVKILVQIDDEVHELDKAGIPYPYDVRKALPRILRETADRLEESANEGTDARGFRAD